jgi:hypothetical protein
LKTEIDPTQQQEWRAEQRDAKHLQSQQKHEGAMQVDDFERDDQTF